VFTACQGDPKTLILDVRSSKEYARKHVMQAYNIRLAASGAALLVCLSRSTCNVPTPLLLKRDSAGTFLSAVLSYRRRQQPVWRATQDYSKNTYDLAWSKDCWWDRPVVVYGAAGLKKDHPVVQFLARDDHAKTLAVYREGCARCKPLTYALFTAAR